MEGLSLKSKSKFRLIREGGCIYLSVIALGSPTRSFKVSLYMRRIVTYFLLNK